MPAPRFSGSFDTSAPEKYNKISMPSFRLNTKITNVEMAGDTMYQSKIGH